MLVGQETTIFLVSVCMIVKVDILLERGKYNLNGAIPRAGAKCIFGNLIPVDGKHFAVVLLP